MQSNQVRQTITISRQMGSLGREIGRRLGEQLGWRVVAREVINEAARRSGAPEAALAAIDELNLLGSCPSPEACLAYRQAVDQVVQEIAGQGRLVLIGRAGQVILAGRPDVLHLRTIAPRELRAERVAEWQGIPLRAALAQIEASDRFRKNYLKRFYGIDWNDPIQYDLVINTGRVTLDQALQLILAALHAHQVQ
jgi:cytidylate kinase